MEGITIREFRERFPPEYRPSHKLVLARAKALGLGRYWGRHLFLTEAEAECLWQSGSVENTGMRGDRSRCARRTAGSYASELKKAQEQEAKLKRLGLLPTWYTTTTNKPTDQSRN